MVLPSSIFSPSGSWQVFNLGQWLRDIGWTTFPLNINLYASTLCIIVGVIVGVIVTSRRLTSRGAEPGIVVDVALWTIPLGIVFARLGYVAQHPTQFFGPGIDPFLFLKFWMGGMSLFGALLGGVLGIAIGTAITGLRFVSFLDAAVPGLLFGMAAERLGDWFDHLNYGTPTDVIWGLQIPSSDTGYPLGLPSGTLFQPVFLYELLWDLVGIAVILFVASRLKLQWGRVFALFLIWYGLGRSWFESLRIDPSYHFAGIRINVWIAWVAVVVGVVVYFVQASRHPGQEPSMYRHGRGWSPEAAVDSADTYPEVDEGKEAPAATTKPRKVPTSKSVTSGAVTSGAGGAS